MRVGTVVIGVGLLVAVPASARAGDKPVITKPPTIAGPLNVGSTLTASAEWTGNPPPVVAWSWARCKRPNGGCLPITGATTDTYLVPAADLGLYLRVRLQLANKHGSASALSSITTVVLDPLPTPTPTPVETATPEPTPAPPAATPTPAPPAVPAPAPRVPLVFDPFPTVRIKGHVGTKGTRVDVLSVRAPRDVRIDVDCQGKDCPTRHFRSRPGELRLRKFERRWRAGTRLTIRVTKPGYIGKYTRFVFRRAAEPRRVDRCLAPGATKPIKCT
jgi:hypothetical protein